MNELIEKLLSDGLVKSREDAVEIITQYGEAFLKLPRVHTKTVILRDTVRAVKNRLTVH